MAENALGGVLPTAGIVVYFDIHRTHLQTFSAANASPLIAMYAQQRVTARGFEKHGDRADVLAESTIVAKRNSKGNADCVIDDVSVYKEPEHHRRGSLAQKKEN